MYNVTMSKVRGGVAVRTETVQGTCTDRPVIGESFAILAESLSFAGGIRVITTSPITAITEQDDSLIVQTLNSTYKLTIT